MIAASSAITIRSGAGIRRAPAASIVTTVGPPAGLSTPQPAVHGLHPLEQAGQPAAGTRRAPPAPSSATVISSPPSWSLTLIATWLAPLCLAALASSSAAQK